MKKIMISSLLVLMAVVFVGCGGATPTSQFPLPDSIENKLERMVNAKAWDME